MAVTLGNQNITSSTGNLGIGTNTPNEILTVSKAGAAGTTAVLANFGNETNDGNTKAAIRLSNLTSSTVCSVQLLAHRVGANAGADFVVECSNATPGTLTEQFRISELGRVTMPNQPAFHAVMTATSNTASSVGNNNRIPFNSGGFNTGNHYNFSTYAFTAPVAGAYQFNWVLRINNATTYVHPMLKVNGNTQHQNTVFHTITNAVSTTFLNTGRSDVIYLQANDTVAVHQGDSAFTSGNYQSAQCSFSGFLIG